MRKLYELDVPALDVTLNDNQVLNFSRVMREQGFVLLKVVVYEDGGRGDAYFARVSQPLPNSLGERLNSAFQVGISFSGTSDSITDDIESGLQTVLTPEEFDFFAEIFCAHYGYVRVPVNEGAVSGELVTEHFVFCGTYCHTPENGVLGGLCSFKVQF